MAREICLVASGDSRLPANRVCWPAQQRLEARSHAPSRELGLRVVRGHPVDPVDAHGFLDGQARGIEVFRHIDPDVPLVVAEAVWQYTSHVLPGLTRHRGPILTLANWSGQWPGLVGLLNLNGSLTKAGVRYSTIWSEDFDDDFARDGAASSGCADGPHRARHLATCGLRRARPSATTSAARPSRGAGLGRQLRARAGHHGRLRRRLHGDVQRDHPRPPPARGRASSRSA